MSRAAVKNPPPREEYVLSLLRRRYCGARGNGEEYAFMSHVRDAASWDGRRTIDALAMSMWKSRGCELHGFEVKCQRRDWLEELRTPEKAEAWCKLVDRFWLVAGAEEIVRAGELPPTWGLIVVRRGQLRVAVEAPALRTTSRRGIAAALPPGFTRSALASMMRSASRVGSVTREELEEARAQAREEESARSASELAATSAELERLRERAEAFERASGVSLRFLLDSGEAARIGDLVKRARAGERVTNQSRRGLERVAQSARAIAQSVEEELAQLDATVEEVQELDADG